MKRIPFLILMLVVVSADIMGLLHLGSSLPMPQGTKAEAVVTTENESALQNR
jgi:hypothetical protein